ncbi:hypothetical protein M0R45_021017 [Rubus argutus]|uniref:Uncharacterized protein n=1 Tax=Rubus argutus TaxID=59490 RepID=A0AAW1XBU0_RUBAR
MGNVHVSVAPPTRPPLRTVAHPYTHQGYETDRQANTNKDNRDQVPGAGVLQKERPVITSDEAARRYGGVVVTEIYGTATNRNWRY